MVYGLLRHLLDVVLRCPWASTTRRRAMPRFVVCCCGRANGCREHALGSPWPGKLVPSVDVAGEPYRDGTSSVSVVPLPSRPFLPIRRGGCTVFQLALLAAPLDSRSSSLPHRAAILDSLCFNFGLPRHRVLKAVPTPSSGEPVPQCTSWRFSAPTDSPCPPGHPAHLSPSIAAGQPHRHGSAPVGHHRTAASSRGQLCSDHLQPNRQRRGVGECSLVLASSCAGLAFDGAHGNVLALAGQESPPGREVVPASLLVASPPVASTCYPGTYRPLR